MFEYKACIEFLHGMSDFRPLPKSPCQFGGKLLKLYVRSIFDNYHQFRNCTKFL